MAILKNLIVNGSSKFLNKAYFQDVQIGGTASLSSLSLSGNLSVTGTSTLTGNTTVGGTLGVTGATTFSGQITTNAGVRFNGGIELYGGASAYIDFHYNNSTSDYTSRILESSSGTIKVLNNLYANNTISAPTGIIPTLNSTNVNVTNNLRANHYDLQTVAQLGGSFYVSPTVKFPNSGTTLAVAKSGTTLTLTITDSSITSATMAGVVWTAGSGVKVSGTINGVVTGTMDGTVSSINTSSHTLTLSVSGENSGNVQASPSGSPYNASQFKDLSVMLYTRKQDGTSKMINTANGAIASFTDGGNNVPVKQLVVDIEPVQDLHGQANPWPAGGSKNKLVYPYLYSTSQTSNGVTFTANSDGSITANGTATANAVYTFHSSMNLADGTYILSGGKSAYKYLGLGYYNSDSATTETRVNNNTTGGATFTAHKGTVTYIQLIINNGQSCSNEVFYPMIRPSSVSDESFAPYSNICPISGHTSAVVTRTGKNLLNAQDYVSLINCSIDANGVVTATASDSRAFSPVLQLWLNSTFVGFGTKISNTDFRFVKDATFNRISFGHSGATKDVKITYNVGSLKDGETYIFTEDIISSTNPLSWKNMMIRPASDTDETYAPYNSQTVTISLDGTRYGGTLDVGTGVLTVDRKYRLLNGVNGDGVTYNSNGHTTNTTRAFVLITDKAYGTNNMISSSFIYQASGDSVGMMNGRATNNGIEFYLNASVPNTEEGVKAWFAENPTDLVYELAEPLTVQLTAQEVRTLSGYNNIWSNTGDTNLIYETSQYDTTSNYNVGIWMNCYDQANSSSTIRVYNGSSRWPNVFLGNMTNADLPRVNGNEPYGYGLYSDNVFLRGIISATGGLIGNWTIGTTGMYYNSDAPGSTSITMIPGGTAASTTSIGGSSGSKSWIFTGKNLFGIDTTGKLYASSAEISGKITATSGYFGGSDGTNGWEISTGKIQSTYTYNNATKYMGIGTYNHSWAFYSGASTNGGSDGVFKVGHGGEMYATNAHITGEITAQSGTIGGFHITSSSNQGTSSAGGHIYTNSLYRHSGDGTTYEYEFGMKGDAAENPSSSSTATGNLAFYVKRINKGAAWNGTNTNMFYVTHKGFMYCKEAEIAGKITATSGAIAGWRIESTYLASGTATAPAANTLLLSPAGTSSSYTVAGTAKSGWMITAGTTFGVNKDGGVYATSGAIGPWNVTSTSIYKAANTLGSTTSGAAYFGDLGLSIGNKFKVDASGVATLGLSSGYHATMDTDSFDVLNGSTMLATFGADSVIGNMNARGVSINSDGFKFNSEGKTAFYIGIDNRSGSTVNEATGYTLPSNPEIKYINQVPYYLLTTIPSDRTVIEVGAYAEMEDPEAESRIFYDWIVDDNKLYIDCNEVDQKYDAAVDFISYVYTTNSNTQTPYCMIGDNAYSSSNPAGPMSFVQGCKCLALGAYSTSVGWETLASGTSSFSLGKRSEAHGAYSFAGGALSTSRDFVSFAYGYKSNAWGKHSVAFGNQDLSTWIFEILITSCDTEHGDITFRITQRAETFEDYISTGSILVSTDNQYIFEDIVVTSGSGTSTITFSCVLYGGHFPAVNSVLYVRVNPPGSYGNGAMSVNACCASGISSTALGIGTAAAAGGSLAIGMYNIPESNVLFSIGNGTMLENHNAMTVDLLGNVVASGNIACTGISAPLFIEKSFQTGNLSVGANAAFSINFNQLSGYSIPNGYRAIAFSHISVNNNYLYFRWMNPVSSYNGAIAVGRNSSSSTQSFALQVRIIFALTSLFGT